ncbi:MAG: uroporphyrinogen decarboxylase family protein [Armatimonadota bacterium]
MTKKERTKLAIDHQETDIVPYMIDFTPPPRALLAEHYGTEDVEGAIGNHITLLGPPSGKPLYSHPDRFGDEVTDDFGVVWHTSQYDRGLVKEPALKEPSLEGYRFPDPRRPERYAKVPGLVEKNRDNFIGGVCGDFFERASFMRGQDEFLADLLLHPGFVEELLDGLLECMLGTAETLAELPIDSVFISDDYGHQDRLAMRPEVWRRFIKPRLGKLFGWAKDRGLHTMLHSCGCIEEIIPDLIDIGLDILHPIQPETMDIFALKREYGADITFCGGISTQRLMPAGTPRSEVRAEVLETKRRMAAGGGYILAPAITLQRDTPLENLLALIEAAQAPMS